MAVYLEFINLIIPRPTVEKRYPGGWEQCIADGMFMWHDDNLIRDGAMNAMDIERLVDQWKQLGFRPTNTKDGKKHWDEMCVVEAMSRKPTLPCDWINISDDGAYAWLKGTKKGKLVISDSFEVEPIALDDEE